MTRIKALILIIKELDWDKLVPESGHGSLTIKFQNFNIVNCEKKESIKP